jgi:hypothetical protein
MQAEAVPFIAVLCIVSGQTTVDQIRQSTTILGFDVASMSFGNFTAMVDGEGVKVHALRTPGKDASAIIQSFGLFAAFAGISPAGTSLTSANIGGKNVTVAMDSGGRNTYFYVSGDTLIVVDNATDPQATAVLQALP